MTGSIAAVSTPSTVELVGAGDLDLLLLIRHFELALLDLFERGMLNGTTHTCLGQEYIPVALRTLLRPEDFVFSNHRGHGHYLARFGDPHGLLAEIMGRDGAVCHGVGGSQHILAAGYLSTGVQGQSLPVAAGVALHLRRAGGGGLAVAHIGDGTWGEGAVYEALNLAALWRLPLLVVVEHNKIAQSTPTEAALSGTIGDRARAFGVAHHRTGAVEPDVLRAELESCVDEVRAGAGPLVVELDTYRVGPHSKGDDTRDAADLLRAKQNDWYPRYAAILGERFAAADRRQRDAMAAVVREVVARPDAVWEGSCANG